MKFIFNNIYLLFLAFTVTSSNLLRERFSSYSELDHLSHLNNCDNIIHDFSTNFHTPYTKDVIMAHRGFWGYYPEHSIRGFELAYFMGAHYLETDVNLTKDKKLIIFHDPILDETTDIAEHPEFQNRKRNQTIDGIFFENKFFVSDFTYDELLTLYVKQRNPSRPQLYNKEFKILLIEELIEMALKYNRFHNKTTGIFIEPKCPEYYEERLHTNINEVLEGILRKYELTDKNSEKFKLCPIVIQSFEYESLVYFKEKANLPQIALMSWRKFYNIKDLQKVSDGLGPDVDFILYNRIDDLFYFNGTNYRNEESFRNEVVGKKFHESLESLGERIMNSEQNKFLCYASSLGLIVYPWNINNDNPRFYTDPVIEYAKLSSLGVSGFFSDFCDTAMMATKYSKDLINKKRLNY
jgi:glycerophosphoryl diester phosphodiesterase